VKIKHSISLLLIALLIVVAVSGCLEGPTKTTTKVVDETITLADGEYTYWSPTLYDGDIVEVSVQTSGIPVNVWIMDSNNFDKFSSIVSYGEYREFFAVNKMNIVRGELSLTIDHTATWHIIIDNTDVQWESGVPGKSTFGNTNVDVKITVTR